MSSDPLPVILRGRRLPLRWYEWPILTFAFFCLCWPFGFALGKVLQMRGREWATWQWVALFYVAPVLLTLLFGTLNAYLRRRKR